MLRRFSFFILLLLLSACGGPLSMISYAVGAGVMMHANDDALRDSMKERYSNKCMPTHRKENPMISGDIKKAQGDLIWAYEFYIIAAQLGYNNAKQALDDVSKMMSPKQLAKAEINMKKYTEIHLSSCFYSEK